ncbi:MAG: hypothetical protein GWO24_38460, partial [Akkermansiaceae bacterium]|nr:hypothetical protein [Akkermansiaceae bacterium]
MIRLGDLENANGNEDRAREFYTKAKEFEEKMSPFTEQIITSRLDNLGVALPVTVPRPEPPKPTPPQ